MYSCIYNIHKYVYIYKYSIYSYKSYGLKSMCILMFLDLQKDTHTHSCPFGRSLPLDQGRLPVQDLENMKWSVVVVFI